LAAPGQETKHHDGGNARDQKSSDLSSPHGTKSHAREKKRSEDFDRLQRRRAGRVALTLC
jgi:hypothetical protein